MANNKEKTYWPHMIVGFLLFGILLAYWTVKSAISMPVQESNEYMLKYQMADIHINEITQKKIAFDKEYIINIVDVKTRVVTDNIHSNLPAPKSVILSKGKNSFYYQVTNKDGVEVSDANVTFALTRPHSVRDDKVVENISFVNGKYQIEDINITKEGRYTLQLRAQIADKIGYSQISAYLKL